MQYSVNYVSETFVSILDTILITRTAHDMEVIRADINKIWSDYDGHALNEGNGRTLQAIRSEMLCISFREVHVTNIASSDVQPMAY